MHDNVVSLRRNEEFEQRCAQWLRERVEWDAFEQVSERYIELMEVALKSDDVWEPIRVMARAERIMELYAAMWNDRWFPPLQRQLQDALYTAHRIARRLFIRRALTCSKEQQPHNDAMMKSGAWEGRGAIEDFDAVERHLDEGRRLLDGLGGSRRFVDANQT